MTIIERAREHKHSPPAVVVFDGAGASTRSSHDPHPFILLSASLRRETYQFRTFAARFAPSASRALSLEEFPPFFNSL